MFWQRPHIIGMHRHVDGIHQEKTADEDQQLIKVPSPHHIGMGVDHPEEHNVHNIIDRIHDDPEKEVQAKLHGPAEGKAQKVEVEPYVPFHQIPTPVYLLFPAFQINQEHPQRMSIQPLIAPIPNHNWGVEICPVRMRTGK